MLKIIEYYNQNDEFINVFYEESLESVVIWNIDKDTFKVIKELKNMKTDLLEFIVNDFDSLEHFDKTILTFEDEDFNRVDGGHYYVEFIDQLEIFL